MNGKFSGKGNPADAFTSEKKLASFSNRAKNCADSLAARKPAAIATEPIFYVRVFKRRLANAGNNGLNSSLLCKSYFSIVKTIFIKDH
ncbi:MAG: hypothetical protein B0W54_10610 [Cellvibrio sp. 79]|nr:MAG: hypothetical protein B0W54_10610 [Cellvibrio sp. 79]